MDFEYSYFMQSLIWTDNQGSATKEAKWNDAHCSCLTCLFHCVSFRFAWLSPLHFVSLMISSDQWVRNILIQTSSSYLTCSVIKWRDLSLWNYTRLGGMNIFIAIIHLIQIRWDIGPLNDWLSSLNTFSV